jgi:hypothetical protein
MTGLDAPTSQRGATGSQHFGMAGKAVAASQDQRDVRDIPPGGSWPGSAAAPDRADITDISSQAAALLARYFSF